MINAYGNLPFRDKPPISVIDVYIYTKNKCMSNIYQPNKIEYYLLNEKPLKMGLF